MNLSDRVVSWIRTAVPGLWAALITMAATELEWLPAPVVDWLGSEATVALVGLAALAAWHALWRWLEPRLPAFLARFLLGSARTPIYEVRRIDHG